MSARSMRSTGPTATTSCSSPKALHRIEYQGGGHYKGAHTIAARDAVKKEALRRAGIGYVEVVAGDTPAELRRVEERLVLAAPFNT
ncbi:hypothetical protein GCM10023325_09740 [Sphingomonas lutea]